MSVALTLPQSVLAEAETAFSSASEAPAHVYVTGCAEPATKKYPDAVRALQVVPAQKGVTASDLAASLPSGIRLIGCILGESSAASSDAAAAALAPLAAVKGDAPLFLVQRDGTSAERISSAGKRTPATVALLSPAEVASAGELCVLHASYIVTLLGASLATIADDLARLAEDMRATQPTRFVWQVEVAAAASAASSSSLSSSADAPTTTKKELAHRILQDETDEAEGGGETVGSWMADENPITQRRKAQAKLNASSSSSSSSSSTGAHHSAAAAISSAVAATVPVPEYAMEVTLLQRSSPAAAAVDDDGRVSVPTLHYTQCTPVRRVQARFSVLHYAPADSQIPAALASLRAALASQIAHAASLLRSSTAAVAGQSSSLTLQALHFHPREAQVHHALTSVFLRPTSTAAEQARGDPEEKHQWVAPPADGLHPNLILPAHEQAMTPQRELLHRQWHLQADRPAFRLANAFSFPSAPLPFDPIQAITQPRLFNVHEALPLVSATGARGRLSLVQGRYAYYHYLQDRLNDAGWGCAYRTLQTICSWYILQGYTRASHSCVPTHRAIQQILVAVGDKEARFVDSRDWIGSTEVGLVLDYAYGMVTKTLFVSSGSEVSGHARHFRDHFASQGTPIMIGGGVLAYGMLGVDYNEDTGECRFLILDPHYTGADTLAPMVKGGWIGWKKSDLFLADHFYNFAMPQRPNHCV